MARFADALLGDPKNAQPKYYLFILEPVILLAEIAEIYVRFAHAMVSHDQGEVSHKKPLRCPQAF